MALFELSDLAAYLQRDSVDTTAATLARRIATGLIEAYAHQPIESAEVTQSLRIDLDRRAIHLPRGPVTSVDTVTVAGSDVAWTWNTGSRWVLLTPSAWPAIDQRDPVAEVTYTAGFAAVPDDILAVALSAAARTYANPEGNRSESIDDYSVTRAGADDDLAGASLTRAERQILSARFHSRGGSSPTWPMVAR